MANILGRITNNGVDFLHVDADPSAGPGTPALQGTVAAVSSGSLWQKTGALDTAWTQVGSSSIPGNKLVFQPGGVSSGNLYGTWGEIVTALASINGSAEVEFDFSISGSPVVIPPGAYSLGEVTFTLSPRVLTFPVVQFGTGTTIDGLVGVRGPMILESTGTTSPIAYTSGVQVFILDAGARLISSGTAPFVDIQAGVSCFLSVFTGAQLSNAGGSDVVGLSATSNLQINFFESGLVQSDVLAGPAGAAVTYTVFSAASNFSTTQTNLVDPVVVSLQAIAARTGYTPTTPGDWSPVPDDVGEALDQLASGSTLTSSVSLAVNQPAHGFSVLDVVRLNASTYILAQANAPQNAGLFLVTEVVDANNFVVTQTGQAVIPAHGLTPDEYYFLSDIVPGGLVLTSPNISNPIVYVQDVNTIWVFPWRPLDLTSASAVEESYITRSDGTAKGSTNTNVVRFLSAGTVSGTDLTYVPDAVNGDSFLVNTTGLYSVSLTLNVVTPSSLVTINAGVLQNLTLTADHLAGQASPPASANMSMNWVGPVSAGSSIYILCTSATAAPSLANTLSIVRLNV